MFNKSLRKFAAQLQHYSDRFPQLASDNCDETDSSSIHNSPLSQFPQENHTNLRNLRQHSQLTTHNSLLPNCASNLALDSFLLNHFHLEGARALRFLIQHPNEDFTAQALVQILSGTIGYEKYIPFDHMQQTPEDRDVLQETPLIMTDEATLDQVRKRMEQIDLQKAQLKNRQPDCAELMQNSNNSRNTSWNAAVPMANCAASTRSAAAPTRLFAAISTACAKS